MIAGVLDTIVLFNLEWWNFYLSENFYGKS